MRIRRGISSYALLVATAALLANSTAEAFQISNPLARLRNNGNNNESTMEPNTSEMDLQQTLGIPDGLMATLIENNKAFSKRIWVVDNSGSMALGDGTQLLNPGQDCTRWKELEETVLLHAQLSSALHQPTEFRMLNAAENGTPQRFSVGYDTMRNSLKQAQTVLSRTSPKGSTPLCESIASIKSEITRMLPQLKADGSRVAIIICTDGCNYNLQNLGNGNKDESEINAELSSALESLQGLPVSVVVRLCTDYGPLIDFYDELDDKLDRLDVLNDYISEAKEVYQHNPWLNYNLILHRMREMGQYSQLFDWLDERTFTREELKEFCRLLFGQQTDLPDPNQDWKGFLEVVNELQSKEKLHLNPRTQQMAPWIDIEGLAMLE